MGSFGSSATCSSSPSGRLRPKSHPQSTGWVKCVGCVGLPHTRGARFGSDRETWEGVLNSEMFNGRASLGCRVLSRADDAWPIRT